MLRNQKLHRTRGSTLCRSHVRFGSKADMCSAQVDVRFTPKSGHVRALGDVCFVPKADIAPLLDYFVGADQYRV